MFADLWFITTFGDFYQACWMLEGTSQHNFGGATNAMGSVPKTKTYENMTEIGGDGGMGPQKYWQNLVNL